MGIPKNITKDHLLKAISKIDTDGIPKDGDSQYYDVIYNGKKYPPKLIVSYANIFANGSALNRNIFEGGIGTPCFKLLEDYGFTILKKSNMIIEKIKSFCQEYKKEIILPYSKELKSFKILVNELPQEIKPEVIEFSKDLNIKGSLGQGYNAFYPWLGIFDNRVSSSATTGFYVVLLFSDDFEDLYLTLNQGSTIQTAEQVEAYRNFVYKIYPEVEGFERGRIPAGGLVKKRSGSAAKNGKKYEETNIFYRKYYVNSLNEEDFINHLKTITKVYTDCAGKYSKNDMEQIIDNSLKEKPSLFDSKTSFIEKFSGFDYVKFCDDLENSGIRMNSSLPKRFISSLLTKPFVILTGLSGSGKTKLAQAFAMWICEKEDQYCIVPVGADWTNREPLLGFPNALEAEKYVKPDNGVLDLIIEANKNENQNKPYFLILDEMNLSHVERYYADFLSVMESKSKISLHSGDNDWSDVPAQIGFPKNLFIIGTVNIDETTYMFSPKVLDRASVIEFRVTASEMESYLGSNSQINLDKLKGGGKNMAESFVEFAKDTSLEAADTEGLNKTLISFFAELKKTGAEFGYRSASEIIRFVAIANKLDAAWSSADITDAAIMQKLLPKVHGSRRKLEPVLKTLGSLCLHEGQKMDDYVSKSEIDFADNAKIKYPVSLEKILRMYQSLISNGFTSYAEA